MSEQQRPHEQYACLEGVSAGYSMKKIKINFDTITQCDLNLAQNAQAVALTDKILTWSPEERHRRLEGLRQKIAQGTASVFEERILVKLLENQTAERIRIIHKNLPAIQRELQRRKKRPPSSIKKPAIEQSPGSSSFSEHMTALTLPPSDGSSKSKPSLITLSSSETPAESGEYPSELLDFLASQKPPTPRQSSRVSQRIQIRTEADEKTTSDSVKEVVVVVVLLIGLGIGLWLGISSEKPQSSPLTFNQQTAPASGQSIEADETFQQVQVEFDAALQELRFGEFEQGKAQLLHLIDMYPDSLQAEEAYITLADTYRLQQDNPDAALKYYQNYLNTFPDHRYTGLALLKMGFTYEDMQDIPTARQMYQQVIERYGEKSRLGQLAVDRLRNLEKRDA